MVVPGPLGILAVHKWPEDGSELIVSSSWGQAGSTFQYGSLHGVAAVHKMSNVDTEPHSLQRHPCSPMALHAHGKIGTSLPQWGELSRACGPQDSPSRVSSQLHGSTSRTPSLLSFLLPSWGPASNKAQKCSVGYSNAKCAFLENS